MILWLKKILNKVGLKFTKNEIKEKDSDLWRRCSMLHRSDYEMPKRQIRWSQLIVT